MYATLARQAEGQYGLPSGILDAIRTRGERSNADQVSSAGARSVYQFIPATRQGMIRNYGVDPWHDPTSATNAAALHLKESYGRTHDWDAAVAGYHGGIKAEHGRGGPQTRAYANRVGSFDGEPEMALGQSLYPQPYYGVDPLAPEPIKDTAPVLNDAGPSTSLPAAAPAAAKKRGGLMGALESVFMPEPDSRWAAALRGGLFDAKANQQAYKRDQVKQDIDLQMTNAKLKSLMTKGEYQIVGNNVFHIPADGSPAEMITPPTTPSEHERLIDRWRGMDDSDPAKKLIERLLTGANSDDVLAAKAAAAAEAARIRAGATTGAATIRANAAGKSAAAQKPPAGFILDQ
jgi:hypothetical protein